MKSLKRSLIAFTLLLPVLLSLGLAIWRSVVDPKIVNIFNYFVYGFVIAVFFIVSIFIVLIILNCTNNAYKLMFGKSAVVTGKNKRENKG